MANPDPSTPPNQVFEWIVGLYYPLTVTNKLVALSLSTDWEDPLSANAPSEMVFSGPKIYSPMTVRLPEYAVLNIFQVSRTVLASIKWPAISYLILSPR